MALGQPTRLLKAFARYQSRTRDGDQEFGIQTPALSDAANRVATAYGVMQWAMPGGEPGHTFVLVDKQGTIRWIRDYGAPENGGAMYVVPSELVPELEKSLN